MSTKRYINSNWPGLQEKVKLEQVDSGLEIDIDIEQQITQRQEARLAGELEKPEQLSIDPEKQISEWHLEKGLKTFLSNVEFEKEDLYTIKETRLVKVDTTISNLTLFAKEFGMNYKELKIHNPWLREHKLNNKSRKLYEIKISLK